jgi:hypothetical protein
MGAISKKCLTPHLEKGDNLFYYCLGPGNNSELIEKMMNRREGWHPTSTIQLR